MISLIDKGTETGDMATIHAFLRKDHGDVDNGEDTVQLVRQHLIKYDTLYFLFRYVAYIH